MCFYVLRLMPIVLTLHKVITSCNSNLEQKTRSLLGLIFRLACLCRLNNYSGCKLQDQPQPGLLFSSCMQLVTQIYAAEQR